MKKINMILSIIFVLNASMLWAACAHDWLPMTCFCERLKASSQSVDDKGAVKPLQTSSGTSSVRGSFVPGETDKADAPALCRESERKVNS